MHDKPRPVRTAADAAVDALANIANPLDRNVERSRAMLRSVAPSVRDAVAENMRQELGGQAGLSALQRCKEQAERIVAACDAMHKLASGNFSDLDDSSN